MTVSGRRTDANVTTRVLGFIALAGIAWMLLALIAMHFTQPDLDPIEHWLSSYVHGSGGWAVRAGFFTTALAMLAIALGVHRGVGPVPRRWLAVALLVAAAVAYTLLGFFDTSPPPFDVQPQADAEADIHNAAAGLLFASLVAVAFVLAGVFRRDDRWRDMAPISRIVAWLLLAALVALGVSFTVAEAETGVGAVTGLVQRMFIATYMAWFLILAWRLVRLDVTTPVEA